MANRRIISITSDGYYYLFVLSFIAGGALLRQVNLLIVLAGVMIGLMIFNWRFAVSTLQQLSVRRSLPEHICAGEAFTVDVIVDNGRHWLDSWALTVEDKIVAPIANREQDSRARDLRANPMVLLPRIEAGESGRKNYRCQLHRRGRYQFGPIRIITRFPLGLVQAHRHVSKRNELTVYPKLGELHGEWQRVLETQMSGEQHSHPRRGVVEGDHYGMRDWTAGDNRRWIHWRASAKLNELKVREFEQHKSQELALILDLWDVTQAKQLSYDPVEFAVSFAATAIVDTCRRNARRVTFAVSADSEFITAGPPSTDLLHEALGELSMAEPTCSDRLPSLYAKIVAESSPATRIVVISTRAAEFNTLFEAAGIEDPHEQQSLLAQLAWVDVVGMDWSNLFELQQV